MKYFKGILLEGQKYGLCKETYKNDNQFMGNYLNNKRNGPGEITT